MEPLQRLLMALPLARRAVIEKILKRARVVRAAPEILLDGASDVPVRSSAMARRVHRPKIDGAEAVHAAAAADVLVNR